MRRAEREVTSVHKIEQIMQRCDVCSLALIDVPYPYVVPLNFGFERKGEQIYLYFHSAGEGKKMTLLKCNPNAAFEMNCSHRLLAGDYPCATSMEYDSVCGRGILHIVEEMEDKKHALRQIMKQYTGKADDEFSENNLRAVAVLRLEVQELSGKSWRR